MLALPRVTVHAAQTACALFVQSVMPALYPYMILLLMVSSRLPQKAPVAVWTALGWGAGSPCGARLCTTLAQKLPHKQLVCLAVTCGTMSPMFLFGTLGAWLDSGRAAGCVLAAVLLGGAAAGQIAKAVCRDAGQDARYAGDGGTRTALTLGQAVERANVTMLTVCGCMVLGSVLCALIEASFPRLPSGLSLVCACLTEVTGACRRLCALPYPLVWRTALLSGETAFGAAAILMQNRACAPRGLMSVTQQVLFQLLHGLISFFIGLGLALFSL